MKETDCSIYSSKYRSKLGIYQEYLVINNVYHQDALMLRAVISNHLVCLQLIICTANCIYLSLFAKAILLNQAILLLNRDIAKVVPINRASFTCLIYGLIVN